MTDSRKLMLEDAVLLELSYRWGYELPFGWVPITGPAEFSAKLEVYAADAFAERFDEELPKLIAETFDVSELYEITEGGRVEFVALADCLLYYDGLERIYADQAFQFLLYFSHESSVTAGGAALVSQIRQAWPEYAGHCWSNPFA